jgi:hypothetical protein
MEPDTQLLPPTSPACRWRLLLLVGLTATAAGATLAAPRLAQPQWYHDFADQRCLLCVPHALNVLSNLPFVLVGLVGLWFTLKPHPFHRRAFIHPAERWLFVTLFAAIVLTGIGSAYYHADPTNARLLWDRLPLAVAFMALFAAVIADRVSARAGITLFLPLVLLGASSVVYWHVSELRGAGDLRPYLFVQLFPLLAVPLMLLLLPPRYTRGADLVAALVCYLLAKALELLDAQVYAHGQVVSGHTLKHLVAGLSGLWLVVMVVKRRPVGHSEITAATALGTGAAAR